ncbi:MAG: [protein-PII] uridylyltransferase [Pseudomonadota bacterium]
MFDRGRIHTQIETLAETTRDRRELRHEIVQLLASAWKDGRAAIAEAIATRPLDSGPAVRAYSHLTDQVVMAAFEASVRYLQDLQPSSRGEKIAVLAVGGYGRGEMCPYSDVDLLFVTPYKITAWAEGVIEALLYILWDMRLKVGHASRTLSDCVRQARNDQTIRTAMLESRFLVGDAALWDDLDQRLTKDVYRGTASEFIELKLAEREERHKKQGGQRYMLEPNVKEGKGGLRDLQSLYWIAKYAHGVSRTEELVDLGVFSREEFAKFQKAESFLWAVRNQLHLISERAMDQLTFDLQIDVANRLGYRAYGGRPAVEHFMQDYFRHATRVGELTRIFLTALEANHVRKVPSLRGILKRKKKLSEGFTLNQGRLSIEDDASFLADKLNILRVFDEALRTGYLIHADVMRLIAANLGRIDDEMRRDPEANKIFLNLLLKRGNPERALRRMNELGVLGAFIPEFQPVVAMMQFNMYHHYTVDEHTIQCITTLAKIERGELSEELPIATQILEEGKPNRRVLYLSLFFHDIGKGRAEDHSILGARIARQVAPRLGLTSDECITLEWLVRYHLLMSDMAQKRDLSDPRTVRDFAKAVKTQRRLDLLTVLTVCDIIGVGPGVWNNWKAMLLRNLYRLTSSALATGLEDLNREAREGEARSALRTALKDWQSADLRRETGRHYGPYWQSLQTDTHVVFAGLLRDLNDDEIAIDIEQDKARDATRVCFAMADHPGIFARLAGAIALVGANTVDARTFTTKDGYATAVFWIQDGDGAPYDDNHIGRLEDMIHKTLKGEVVTGIAIRQREKVKRRERAFRHSTSISFDNEGSEIYTIIEVDTRDRRGLLYDLVRTLADANISIASAQIATYGTQAVDTFYVKDMFGLKLLRGPRTEALERKLLTAIEQGAKKAAE